MELHLDRAAALLSLQLLDEAADAADLAVEGYRRHDGGSLMLAEALVLQARIALAQDRPGPASRPPSRPTTCSAASAARGWRAVAVLLGAARAGRARRPARSAAGPAGRATRTLVRLRDGPAAVEAGLLHGELAAAAGHARTADAALAGAAARAAGGPALLRLQGHRAAALRAGLAGDDRRPRAAAAPGWTSSPPTAPPSPRPSCGPGPPATGAPWPTWAPRRAAPARPERIWTWLEQAARPSS